MSITDNINLFAKHAIDPENRDAGQYAIACAILEGTNQLAEAIQRLTDALPRQYPPDTGGHY